MIAKNDAIKLLEDQRIQEQHDERMDVVVSMMKSPLHTFKHGKRTYRS
jgi:hypothetical protein